MDHGLAELGAGSWSAALGRRLSAALGGLLLAWRGHHGTIDKQSSPRQANINASACFPMSKRKCKQELDLCSVRTGNSSG
ncbi:hypothetical protein E4U42_003795 [Claviceps africana]|uniref:Uncharacterized protein n=1 Tax=Claviceps africana TaxID=83212 RepID=A0A8K0NGK6_9HYPO|nr:hypothetical protein E4U42_003795 [Claviceps africana]